MSPRCTWCTKSGSGAQKGRLLPHDVDGKPLLMRERCYAEMKAEKLKKQDKAQTNGRGIY